MQAGRAGKAGILAMTVFALVACEEGAPFGGQTFRSQYAVARNALEAGDYDKAGRSYQHLMEKAGPLEPRLRLEYAHALLRQGDFAGAAAQSGALVAGQKGAARAAALAVKATAEHELALQALAGGDKAGARRLLDSADKGMAEVLKTYPEMDPLGGLAARRASIKVRKKAL